MKNFVFFAMALFLLSGAYAQQSKKEIKVDPRLTEILGAAKVNDLRANNPKQLLIEHINLNYYCIVALKMTEAEGTFIMKDDLKNHVKAGKQCDYQEMIISGVINRYDFDLEQHEALSVVYPMGNTGAYVIVFSKQVFDLQKNAMLSEYGF
ncbi:MAG: hypothetical protein J5644_01730 [Bacteroidales bacterium]|nr:hypothetical protein [Bacteroidales bacterium]